MRIRQTLQHGFLSNFLCPACVVRLDPPPPGTATASLVNSSLDQLIPPELSLETFNNEYLQRQGSSAKIIFAAAHVSKMLDTPSQAVENLLFGVLAPELETDVQVKMHHQSMT